MTGHLASRTILKKVDKLRELNIGSGISLPQVRPLSELTTFSTRLASD